MKPVNPFALAVTISQLAITAAVVVGNAIFGWGWAIPAILFFAFVGFWLWNVLCAAAIRCYVYAMTPQVKVQNSADIVNITERDGVH